MGKIIPGNFGRRPEASCTRAADRPEESTVAMLPTARRRTHDASGVLEMSEEALGGASDTDVWARTLAMRRFIGSLRGLIRPHTVAQWREDLKAYDNDQVRDLVLIGTEEQWNVHRAFYWALYQEVRQRKL